jgi:hypothetical protein
VKLRESSSTAVRRQSDSIVNKVGNPEFKFQEKENYTMTSKEVDTPKKNYTFIILTHY